LKSFTKQIPVRHLLFVIDACLSKRARIQLGKGDEVEDHPATSASLLEELMRNTAVQVITAGFKGQQCHIGKENSVFTEMFVQGNNINNYLVKVSRDQWRCFCLRLFYRGHSTFMD
jgi:hypothetical protein